MKYSTPASLKVTVCGLVAACTVSSSVLADDAVTVAARIGITPASLTMAGVTTIQAQTIFDRLDAATTLQADLATAVADVETVVGQISQYAQTLNDDPADGATCDLYEAAMTAFAQDQTDLASARDALFDHVMFGVSAGAIQTVENWIAANGQSVPHEFKANHRTAGQWKSIKLALRAEARAAQLSETLASAHATLLADVRAESAVVSASTELDQDLAAMVTLFDLQ